MSHEIYERSMAFVGRKPWHEIGQELDPSASIDDWVKAAGMGYRIESTPVLFKGADGAVRTMENQTVLYRGDTGDALSVVTGRYNVVQPHDVLEFFRDLCKDRGLTLETAGVLKGGRVYWALAKIGDSFEAKPGDRHEAYVLLYTSADLSLSTTGSLTDVRVVCWNTMRMSISGEVEGSGKVSRVSHATEFGEAAQRRMKADLGLVNYEQEWAQYQEAMTVLLNGDLSKDESNAYFKTLLRSSDGTSEAESFPELLEEVVAYTAKQVEETGKPEKEPRGLQMLQASYEHAPGAAPGNAYGAVNAASFYIDHLRGKSSDKRMHSAQFGQGAAFKQRAVDLALKLSA
jgi:phage/plasmid-like protein (TIGR03299 family)